MGSTYALVIQIVRRLFIQIGKQDLLPRPVSFLVHLQLIGQEETIDRLSFRSQHRMINIDKNGMTVLGHEIPDHIIGLLYSRHQSLPAGTWLYRNIDDVHFLQPAADQIV